MCGGKEFLVRVPEKLRKATIEGFGAKVPVIVNIIIQSGKVKKPVSITLHNWSSLYTKKTFVRRALAGRQIQK